MGLGRRLLALVVQISDLQPQQALSRLLSRSAVAPTASTATLAAKHRDVRSCGDEILEWVAPADSSADTRLHADYWAPHLERWASSRERRARCAVSPRTVVRAKPMRACEPSQNGLLPEAPQRHSRADCVRKTMRPVPEQISTFPSAAGAVGERKMSESPAFVERLGSDRRWLRWRKIRRRHGCRRIRFSVRLPQRHSVTRNSAAADSS